MSKELVIGDNPGEYTEADVPGYYFKVTQRVNEYVVLFEMYPSAKLVDGKLVAISKAEGEQAFVNGRV